MRLALIIVGSTIALMASLAGAVYAASQLFDSTKTEEHSFSERVRHVVVEIDAGDLDIVQGDRRVEVRETRHYVLDSPDTSRSVEDGVLTLRAECDGVLFAACETDYRVEVPRGVTVDVRTHVGDIDAKGIDARRIEARSNVGDVTIEAKRRAQIDARTNVGDVAVKAPRGTRDVDAHTDVGDTDVDVEAG
jgi:hypothetical protein